MDKTSIVLKTDKGGRVRTPAHRRDAVLDEFERRSLPAVKFSKLVGVRYQTFATWVQKRKQSQAITPKPGGSVRFAEAVLEAQAPHKPSAALRVILPGGAAMELSHGRHFWTHTCPAVLFTNWLVWIPSVVLVYSLPGPLQFPLFSVVMCFFILIVTLLARGHTSQSTGH